MRIQTFVGKVSMDALRQMDEHINDWLEKHKVQPRFISQAFGNEHHSQHPEIEPVLVTSIWYE